MTDYKLVPFEPTPEMVSAAEDAYMPFGDMDLALRMAILAAPDVQGEPVARVKTVGGYPDESEHVAEWLCKHKDLKDGDYLYLVQQPAEQQPDVTQLVEALEQCVTSMIDSGYRADAVVIQAARAALSAYRKGGEK